MNQIIMESIGNLIPQEDSAITEAAKTIGILCQTYDIKFTQQLVTSKEEIDTSTRLYKGTPFLTAYASKQFGYLTALTRINELNNGWCYATLCTAETYTDNDGYEHALQVVIYTKDSSDWTSMNKYSASFGILDTTEPPVTFSFDQDKIPLAKNLYYMIYHTGNLQLTPKGFGTIGKTKTWKDLLGG